MITRRHLIRAMVFLALFASACRSDRVYRQLRSEYGSGSSPTVAAESPDHGPPPSGNVVTADGFLEQAQAKLLATKKRWEAVLTQPMTTVSLADFKPGVYEVYHDLAAAPDLDQQLAAGSDLQTLLGLVHELNPAVAAVAENVRATLEQYPQAAYLDNILQQYNAFTKQLAAKVGPQQQRQMMSMSFPFPDTLALKGQVITEEVEIARRQHEIALRDAMTEMRTAYYSLLFVDQAISINRESQALLEQMINVAQTKIRTDKASYNALIMAQVELSKLSDAIITLEAERDTLVARINTLLDRRPDAALGAPAAVTDSDLDLPLENLYATAIENRQELQQQRLRINRMRTMVELATRMAYPDATPGASYFEDRMRLSSGSSAAPPAFMTERQLDHRQTPWFGQRDAYIHEVEIRIGGLERQLTAMENQTRLAVKQAHFGMQTARRSITLYHESLLPQARQALESTSAGYSSGKTDFLTFLDTQRTLLAFRLEEHRAWRDFRTYVARLEQLAGRALPCGALDLTAPHQPVND